MTKAIVALVVLLGVGLLVRQNVATSVDAPAVSVAGSVTIEPPSDVLDPVKQGDPLPDGFRQLLRRDAIDPVYAPRFVDAADSEWRDRELVIGVEIDGEAKAYPIEFLNRREMVNDELGGIPILVSW